MNKKTRSRSPITGVEPRIRNIDHKINDMQTASARNTIIKQHKKLPLKPKLWGCIQFNCKKLQQMYETGHGSHKYSEAVVENFYEKMQILDIASNEQDLRKYKSLEFHKLKKGQLKGQYAISLTGNWRLILRIEEDEESKYLLIMDIVDYH